MVIKTRADLARHLGVSRNAAELARFRFFNLTFGKNTGFLPCKLC